MRRPFPWTAIAAWLALLIAIAAVGVAIEKMAQPAPKAPAQQPLGVCVVTDPYAFGTDGGGPYAAVRSVTAPVRRDGVLACPEGQFVSVQPK